MCVKIPVLKKAEYDEICAAIGSATKEMIDAIGEEFSSFIASMKTPHSQASHVGSGAFQIPRGHEIFRDVDRQRSIWQRSSSEGR